MLAAERIKQLRKEANLTQEELGDLLGLKKVSIQKYENGGIVNLKSETIEKLSQIFKVSPAYIMGWEKFDKELNTNEIKKEINLLELIQQKYGFIGVELAQVLEKLNDEGKRKILFYAEDIAENRKYKNNVN